MWWFVLAACHSSPPGEPPTSGTGTCEPLEPAWPDAVTTLTDRLVTDPVLPSPTAANPTFADGLQAALDQGLGGYTTGPGEPHVLREDVANAGSAPDRRSLAFFFQQTDAQIADAESPDRLVAFDAPSATEAAARPQELYAIHSLDALVRAANSINAQHPLDFALITGDNSDSAQKNETRWFIDTLDGLPVHPDSGDANSQVDPDCNDPVAEFQPAGLDVPWYAVLGNHDRLVQGNLEIDSFLDQALGTIDASGTRDLSKAGGPMTYTTVADAGRALLDRAGMAAEYLDTTAIPGPVGHGFTSDNVDASTAYWVAHPVAGVPLKLIGLDTSPDGPGAGVLRASIRDDFLIPELDSAAADGEIVVLTSHYSLRSLPMSDGGIAGDLLVTYPNVVLSVVGHSHENRISAVPAPGGGGFWEIETSSTVDWPQQGRLLEVVDNSDGTLSIFATLLDVLAPEGSMAARSRMLSLVDLQSGWHPSDGSGTELDRNAELVVPLPSGVVPSGWRERVESIALP